MDMNMNLLIRKARRRDKAAFQQLMEEQGKPMYRVAKAILKNDEDVADAMQETALACWEKIDTLKKDRYFQTWLMRILINNCNAIYRQRSRIISDEVLPEEISVDNGYANVEWEFFLNSLEEKYRILIILYYVQGFKTKEIASILELNESTVRARLAAARKKAAMQYTDGLPEQKKAKTDKKVSFIMAERGF
jgi:RNA polymerase sigma-70 factor (ECF subfamily)